MENPTEQGPTPVGETVEQAELDEKALEYATVSRSVERVAKWLFSRLGLPLLALAILTWLEGGLSRFIVLFPSLLVVALSIRVIYEIINYRKYHRGEINKTQANIVLGIFSLAAISMVIFLLVYFFSADEDTEPVPVAVVMSTSTPSSTPTSTPSSMPTSVQPTHSETVTAAIESFTSSATAVVPGSPVTIPLTCPETWFFSPSPEECPDEAVIDTVIIEQEFERGRMLYIEEQARVYALFDDGFEPGWISFEDGYDPAIHPESEESFVPPSGRHQPIAQLGYIWRENDVVRNRLGLGIEAENPYDGSIQTATMPDGTESLYISSTGAVVLQLIAGDDTWQIIPLR